MYNTYNFFIVPQLLTCLSRLTIHRNRNFVTNSLNNNKNVIFVTNELTRDLLLIKLVFLARHCETTFFTLFKFSHSAKGQVSKTVKIRTSFAMRKKIRRSIFIIQLPLVLLLEAHFNSISFVSFPSSSLVYLVKSLSNQKHDTIFRSY